MLGPGEECRLARLAVLVVLTLASYAIDSLAVISVRNISRDKVGHFWRHRRRACWSLFFGIVGLFIGPVLGAIVGEFIAGKRMIDAGRAAGGVAWKSRWHDRQTNDRSGHDSLFVMTAPSPV